MWKNEVFSDINGCVSTGKEANVYHAATGDGQDLAVKIYKTSILVFKDRERYAVLCVAFFKNQKNMCIHSFAGHLQINILG
jgi:serine/threonine-protein kinase RIO1